MVSMVQVLQINTNNTVWHYSFIYIQFIDFYVLQFNTHNSVRHLSFVCIQFNGFKYCKSTLIILFDITHSFTYSIDFTSLQFNIFCSTFLVRLHTVHGFKYCKSTLLILFFIYIQFIDFTFCNSTLIILFDISPSFAYSLMVSSIANQH